MKIAFVPPWYGIGIPGGAEAEVRRTAEHLRRAGIDVEVLTTTVKDFHSDWGHNHHRPGRSVENGVPVRRFSVRKRRHAAFDAVNAKLMSGQTVDAEEERIYVEESIRSPALEQYIAEHLDSFHFVFIPYLFGTTYWGVQACQGKALLIPCLHDEAYIRMGVFREMFEQVQLLILHVDAERRLAELVYGLPREKSIIIGEGVDTDWTANAEEFRDRYQLPNPFVLYAGRRERGKNVDTLIEYFHRFRNSHTNVVDLVLIGSGALDPLAVKAPHIHDLGYVSVADKYNAYAAASILCQPSLHESFSLVIMEAWVAGTPVLVHGDCEATREHCVRSNGGLFFTNYDEFDLCLNLLLEHEDLRIRLADNGRRYVLENYHWDTIIERYSKLFKDLETQ